MEDILLIDKPVGITSFDVIRRLRKELGVKKMGHAGTLDPLASGLMIIGVGTGTKKLSEYIKLSKEYVTEILLGEKRSTGDMEGEILESVEVSELDADTIRETLKEMIGTLTLPVSAYSAIKKDGVPLYKRVRRGEDVESPLRDMVVTEVEYLEHIDNMVKVRFAVGSGTYIRSLGEEFGKRLGYPAVLKSLRRTKVGKFDIKDAREI